MSYKTLETLNGASFSLFEARRIMLAFFLPGQVKYSRSTSREAWLLTTHVSGLTCKAGAPVLSLADFMSRLLALRTPVARSRMPAEAVSSSCFPAVYSRATLLQAELPRFVQPPGLSSPTYPL